jgi:pyruvate kinase
MRRAKIVATLGPASDSVEMIEKLILSGVNVFRFNFSHNTHEYHLENLKKVREVSARLNRAVTVLQDISGPKIRIGEVPAPIKLEVGGELNFYREAGHGDPYGVELNHPMILDSLVVGALIYLSDGLLRVEVVEVLPSCVKTKVIVGGNLTSKKGVNFPNVSIPIAAITEKDKKDMEFGALHGVDMMAISFVKNADDVMDAKNILKALGKDIPIIPKIEKAEAIANLDAIIAISDGVMVARGDLGVELGLPKVPVAQKKIIKCANNAGIPVITATQMLTSMMNSPFPTRAEVSDVANAVLDGTDAVMLSDETTVGKFPIEVVKALADTICEAETIYPFHENLLKMHDKKDAIAAAADRMAEDLEPDAIIVFTLSGNSARATAKYRPKTPIIAVAHTPETYRRLALTWGVESAFVLDEHDDTDEMICEFVKKGIQNAVIKEDGKYIFVIGKMGEASLIKIVQGEDIKNALSGRVIH